MLAGLTGKQRRGCMLQSHTWVVNDELARVLGAPHNWDVVLEENVGRDQQLLQTGTTSARQLKTDIIRKIVSSRRDAWATANILTIKTSTIAYSRGDGRTQPCGGRIQGMRGTCLGGGPPAAAQSAPCVQAGCSTRPSEPHSAGSSHWPGPCPQCACIALIWISPVPLNSA